MVELSTEPSATSDFQNVLAAATSVVNRSDRSTFSAKNCPSPATVVEALLQAERAAKQNRLLYSPEDLIGQWQLRFSTGTRKLRQGGIALGKGFYMPRFMQAQIGFEPAPDIPTPDILRISNQLKLGTLCFQLQGPARYLNKKNLLAFDFTQMQLGLFGQTIYHGNFRGGQAQADQFAQQPISKLPFFSFFLINKNFIAARGRGGGLAIWTRVR